MAKVPLHCGAFALVDECDLALVLKHKWRIQWAYSNGRKIRPQSVVTGSGGSAVLLHRLLVGVEGLVVDHINGDPLDNRRANLRNCHPAQNAFNRRIHKNNSSGAKGVYGTPAGTWRAAINVGGKKINLGSFGTKSEAAAAYAKAATKYHGEFARVA